MNTNRFEARQNHGDSSQVYKNRNRDKENQKEPKESSAFTYAKNGFLDGTLSSFLDAIVKEKHLGKS